MNMNPLKQRIAKALGWSMAEVNGFDLMTLRELVRRDHPKLAADITYAIRSGDYLTRSDNPVSSPGLVALAVTGVLAAAGAAYFFLTRKKDAGGESTPGPVPAPTPAPIPLPPGPFPAAGVPIPSSSLSGGGTLGSYATKAPDFGSATFQERGLQFYGNPAPYLVIVYTTTPSGSGWAPWDGPKPFRGHEVSNDGAHSIYSSPDDDAIDYLTSLSKAPVPGFWIAYLLPIATESWTQDQGSVVTAWGTPGPWMTGRFGDLTHLNDNPAMKWALALLKFPTSARVTQYVLGTEIGAGLTLEKGLT